jgi:hypothetical protein
MTLIERLRARADRRDLSSIAYTADCALDREAANRLEALEQETEQLRDWLWHCGFWAFNDYTEDKDARLLIRREIREVSEALGPGWFVKIDRERGDQDG